jgi:hypothetical protein
VTEVFAKIADPLPGAAGLDVDEDRAREIGEERLQVGSETGKRPASDLASLPVEDLANENGLVMVGHNDRAMMIHGASSMETGLVNVSTVLRTLEEPLSAI